MNILFVCHRFPFPPQRGGKIRPFNMIRHLTGQGHQVCVASLARSAEEAAAGAGIASHCAEYLLEVVPDVLAWPRMIARVPTTSPSSFGYFASPTLARRIRRRLERGDIDLVVAHCSSAAPYVEHVQGIPKILDFGDMDSQKWRDYAAQRRGVLAGGYWLEAVKLERAERRLAAAFDLCTATTRAELDSLRSLCPTARADWFANGVDDRYFAPAPGNHDPQLIAFVGRMDYFPNQQAMLEFCAQVWPQLRRERPGLQLAIVGAAPSAAVRALASLPGVAVTGSVPDVRPIVARAALTVAPLRIARGTQNKILESLAMGVPVVASSQAARGVDAVPGEHLLVADSADELRQQILALVDDPARRNRLAAAGRARVQTHHSWAHSMARFDALIAACVSRGRTAQAPDSALAPERGR